MTTLSQYQIVTRARRILAGGGDPFRGLHDDEQMTLAREAARGSDEHFRVAVSMKAYAPLERRYCRLLRRDLTDAGLMPVAG